MRSQIFITWKICGKDITDPLHTPTGYFMILRREQKTRTKRNPIYSLPWFTIDDGVPHGRV